MKPKVSIAIISYNGFQRVRWLVESIKINTSMPKSEYEIVLVDDGSFSDTRRLNKDLCADYGIKFIQNEVNLGITRSWNRCVAATESDYVILLNDDILVTPGWMENMLYFLQNNDNAGFVGYPTFFMIEPDMPKYFDKKWLTPRNPFTKKYMEVSEYTQQINNKNGIPGACAVVVGCAFGFRKKVWEDIGGADENIRSLYEDYVANSESMFKGYQNYMLRFPIIYHVLSGTFGSNPQLKASQIMRESEQYYIKKYGGKVNEVADKFFEKNKKATKVKFIDGDGNKREDWCQL